MKRNPIETAPRDGSHVIIAVVCDEGREPSIGEAYFTPSDGEWWWAGTGPEFCEADPISEMNFGSPKFWWPLPQLEEEGTAEADATRVVTMLREAGRRASYLGDLHSLDISLQILGLCVLIKVTDQAKRYRQGAVTWREIENAYHNPIVSRLDEMMKDRVHG